MKQEHVPTRMEQVLTVAFAMLIGPFICHAGAYALVIELWLYTFYHFFPTLHEPWFPLFCALSPGYTFGGSFGMPVIVKC